MPKLFNAIPRHKKPSQSEFTETAIRIGLTESPNRKAREALENYKLEPSQRLEKELKRYLVSGIIFEDLKQEIREGLKCLQIGK